jgi:hypothetical protein
VGTDDVIIDSHKGLLNKMKKAAIVHGASWSWSGDPNDEDVENGLFIDAFSVRGSVSCDIEVKVANLSPTPFFMKLMYNWAGVSPCPDVVPGCASCPALASTCTKHDEVAQCDGSADYRCVAPNSANNINWKPIASTGTTGAENVSIGGTNSSSKLKSSTDAIGTMNSRTDSNSSAEVGAAGTLPAVGSPFASIQLPHVTGHVGGATTDDVPPGESSWHRIEMSLLGCGSIVAVGLIGLCVVIRRGDTGSKAGRKRNVGAAAGRGSASPSPQTASHLQHFDRLPTSEEAAENTIRPVGVDTPGGLDSDTLDGLGV